MADVYLSPTDSRDYTLCRAMDVSGIDIPERYQLEMPQAELQQAGNCVAQANSTRAEYNLANGEQVSVGWLYGNRRETENRGTGLVMRDAMKTIIKYGNLLRKYYEYFYEVPYAIDNFEKAYEQNKDKTFFDERYIRLNTKEDVQRFILRYNTPVFAVVDSADINKMSSRGSMHCVLICGWKPKGQKYKGEPEVYSDSLPHDMIFHNSWGKNWRYDGYGTCDFTILRELWGVVPMEEKMFPDIAGHWAESAITEAARDGILNGYEDGTFRPDQNMTRAEFAAIYQRLKAALKNG